MAHDSVRDSSSEESGESQSNELESPIRRQPFRVLLQLVAAFTLYWITYGVDLADGIVYSRLILPPCNNSSTLIAINSSSYVDLNMTSFSDEASTLGPLVNGTNNLAMGIEQASGNKSTTEFIADCGGFGRGASQTAWVTSLSTAFRVCFALFAGVLIDTFGVRATVISSGLVFSLGVLLSTFATQLYQVYLARGVLSACAAGILFATPVHCFALTFDRKISIATGFSVCGAGAGAIFYGYTGKIIVSVGDWRWYYRMVASVGLLAIPAGLVLFIKPANDDSVPGEVDVSGHVVSVPRSGAVAKLRRGFRSLYVSFCKGKVLYRNVNFLLMSSSYFLYGMGYFFPFIASSHRLTALGMNNGDVYLQSAYVGFGTVMGCVIFMLIGIIFTVRATLLQGILLAVMGLSTILSSLASTEAGVQAYNICYAAFSGMAVAACGPASREIVPADLTVHSFGHMYLLSFPTMALGPPISGWLYDATKSYDVPLAVGGSVMLLSALLLLIADFRIWRQRRRQLGNAKSVSSTHKLLKMEPSRRPDNWICNDDILDRYIAEKTLEDSL